jgi:hypothetical protein
VSTQAGGPDGPDDGYVGRHYAGPVPPAYPPAQPAVTTTVPTSRPPRRKRRGSWIGLAAALAAGGAIWFSDNVADDGFSLDPFEDFAPEVTVPDIEVPVWEDSAPEDDLVLDLEPGTPQPLYSTLGEEAGTVTLDEVTRQVDCTSDFVPDPAGERVGLRLTVEVAGDVGAEVASQVSVNPFSFSFEGNGDGEYGTDWFCMTADDMVPLTYTPGQVGEGWVVLDVAPDTGTILWQPSYVGGAPVYRITVPPAP